MDPEQPVPVPTTPATPIASKAVAVMTSQRRPARIATSARYSGKSWTILDEKSHPRPLTGRFIGRRSGGVRAVAPVSVLGPPCGKTPRSSSGPGPAIITAVMGVLLLLTMLAGVADARPAGSGNQAPGRPLRYREKDYRVEDYEADLAPDPRTQSVRGNVIIHLASRVPSLTVVSLDADGLLIEKATEGARSLQVDGEPGLARVRLTRPARNGERRTIRVWYHAEPRRGMVFLPNGWWYTAFHTEAWLPCDASPEDRATFTFHWTVPAGSGLIATGDEVKRAKLPGAGEVRTIRLAEPYPAYLVGAVAGPLRTVCTAAGGVDLCASIDRDATIDLRPALDAAKGALHPLEQWAGVPFPRKRYDQVFLPNRVVGQELVGMALLSEGYLRDLAQDPREDWLVVHELIHSWWGNRVTCRSWNDFWLNEGLTTFLQAAYKNVRWGRSDYEEEIANARRRYANARRAGKERAVSYDGWLTPPDASGPITYSKGALVFELLRQRLGEPAFWTGLRAYTRAGLKSGVASRDLQRAMEDASGQDLSPLFEQWVQGASPPELVATHRREKGEVVIEIEQRQARLVEMPLSIAVETSLRRERAQVQLHDRRAVVRVPVGSAELRSVRLDDTAALPARIAHDRPLDMLLFQVAHEPDVVGRMEALEALQATCRVPDARSRCGRVASFIAERDAREPSRLVRGGLRELAEIVATAPAGADGGRRSDAGADR